MPVQNLRIGGRSSQAEYQFVVQGLDRPQLYEWAQKMADAMSRDPLFTDVNSDLQINATQATLVVDQDKASSLGISAAQLRSTLYAGFGSRQVSTIFGTGDSYAVVMEFDDKANWTTAELPDVRIRNSDGKLVPIGAFARIERTAGLADHQPARPAAGGDDLVQPAGRACRSATRSTRIDAAEGRAEVAGDDHHRLRRHRQDLPGFARQPGHPADRPRW